uniref:Uncharacterized protein n=1 Tax=Myoviridae sp. ct5Tq8 TaxID=2826612 RepID=A0A8S5NDT2_9CAUD|nr:MAG TPA: hypothetical protein [Myoviridae sp. ct5Tq8]
MIPFLNKTYCIIFGNVRQAERLFWHFFLYSKLKT